MRATALRIAGAVLTMSATIMGTAGVSQASSPQAGATTAPQAPVHQALTAVPATKLGATVNGMTEVDLANGQVIQVPQKEVKHIALTGTIHPYATDYVYGTCGDSFSSMIENPSNNAPYRFNTGFDIDLLSPATYYSWYANISGPSSYVYQYHASGNLLYDYSWRGGHTGSGANGGWWGRVSTSSYAILLNGQVCTSGGPVVFAAL